MKKLSSALLALLLCLTALTACGAKTIAEPAALAEALASADIYSTEIYPLDDSMVMQIFAVTADYTAAYAHASAGDAADELLVITAADEAGAQTLLSQLEMHMTALSDTYAKYAADQCPRIEGGLLMRVGNVVIWCVSNDTDTAKQIVENYQK
ncbi:MAG: DUF4358 domain-containing protein [Clostridia bacterium]|nr:DUF4358 domain-containing protein [Clostridia bacterium]